MECSEERKSKVSLESLYEAQIPYGRFEKHSLFTHVNNNPNENRIKVIRFSFFVVVDKQFSQSFSFLSSYYQYISDVCFYISRVEKKIAKRGKFVASEDHAVYSAEQFSFFLVFGRYEMWWCASAHGNPFTFSCSLIRVSALSTTLLALTHCSFIIVQMNKWREFAFVCFAFI